MKRFNGLIVVLVVIGLLVLGGISSYNGLVSLNQKTNAAYSQIDTNLQRRADLIPNLVETVKGYAKHERGVFDDIASARAKLAGAKGIEEQAAANTELSGALSRLLVVVENYPTLKADANFQQLMDELAGTENRIATSRRDYNMVVMTYNTKIKRFPTVIYANMFGFKEKPYFEADADAKNAPKVNF